MHRAEELTDRELDAVLEAALPAMGLAGQRVCLVIPDLTRTCPLDRLFARVHARLAPQVQRLDVLIALGTHQPLSEAQICERVGISAAARGSTYRDVGFFNHAWDQDGDLLELGVLPAARIEALSEGMFSQDVLVRCNARVRDYDALLICGPVFPHEVAGFSGGNKYLFPGISGPEVLHFFHWLGALITNHEIIGVKHTPVRAVIDAAAAMVPCARHALCMVVGPGGVLSGLYAGTPEEAWSAAADHSAALHIERTGRQFDTVLSCAPAMYPDLWTGGKCMYKLEPVVADGGELIIYAPHIREVSAVHGHLLEQVGYHCRDYFRSDWDRFKDHPWGILAHSTHVRGAGHMVDGDERCRVQVTLATGIPETICQQINLGYRDPAGIDVESFAGREEEGVLLVRKAGEMLYRP